MRQDQEEIKLYPHNIFWEPGLSDAEKILLFEIQYKCRLAKESSTESNKTMGIRLSKSSDTINTILGSLEKKEWIIRRKDYFEVTQRRILLTEKSLSLIQNPFLDWYPIRVGKFAYPPLTKRELSTRVNSKELEDALPKLIRKGMIADEKE